MINKEYHGISFKGPYDVILKVMSHPDHIYYMIATSKGATIPLRKSDVVLYQNPAGVQPECLNTKTEDAIKGYTWVNDLRCQEMNPMNNKEAVSFLLKK